MTRTEQSPGTVGPQIAKRQPALGRHNLAGGRVGSFPGRQVGLTCSLPIPVVLAAQPVSVPAPVSASCHGAGWQGFAAPGRWSRVGEELLHRRVVALAKPLRMGAAQAVPQRLRVPLTAGDDALIRDEDGVVGPQEHRPRHETPAARRPSASPAPSPGWACQRLSPADLPSGEPARSFQGLAGVLDGEVKW